MDSFYDVPRRPPQPIPREMFPATPVVPEISVLCPTNTPKNTFTPYSQWKKDTMSNNFLVLNKENINCPIQNTSILKKQVRFESPLLQQRSLENNKPFLNKIEQNLGKNQIENDSNPKPLYQIEAVPSFEQMYMANIPNRQLDLSVIDLPKRVYQNELKNEGNTAQTIEKEQPKTYREFLETQKIQNKVILNDSVTDIYNYKRNKLENDCLTPEVTHFTHKVSVEGGIKNPKNQNIPVSSPYVFPSGFKELNDKHSGKKEPTQLENNFQGIAEAISQKNMPVQYENVKVTENNKPQMVWHVSQNNNEGLQNRLLHTGTRNQGKNHPQQMGSIWKSEHFVNRGNFENVQSQHGVDTTGFGVKGKKHTFINKGSQTGPSVVDHNLVSLDMYKTTSDPVDLMKKRECYTQTSTDVSIVENNVLGTRCDDLSVTDLLKIIAQQNQQMAKQNEQLLLLQKQVSEVICKQKEHESPRQKSIQYGHEKNCCQQDRNCYNQQRHCCSLERHCEQKKTFASSLMIKNMENIQDRCITSTQHEDCERIRKKLEATPMKNTNNMPNFSIGLTTSFEVSFRGPHYKNNQNDFLQKNKEFPGFKQYEPPKIQEITETDSTQSNENYRINHKQDSNKNIDNDKETLMDESIIFKEPIRVREPCPSPEPSIKINMNDFEDSESEDDLISPTIGASFYRNLMVQVNKILQKAQIETAEEVSYNFEGQNFKSNTLHKVKEATLKHLRRIGVEVQSSEESFQSSSLTEGMDNKSYDEDDISFAVKQLLMKYLPADHLAKIAYKEASDNGVVLTPKEKIGTIKNRPDFSFATVQYMKKYNLIASNQKDFHQASKQNQPESPKILDITKLKQQPKLL